MIVPVVAITIGIDEGPIEDAAFFEVLLEIPIVSSIGGINAWCAIKHIARGRYIIFYALLGFCSKGSGHQ
jgi:hypothetical protein